MTRALVTGAGGFVGRWLIRHLREEGWSVAALTRAGGMKAPSGVESFLADITDADATRAAIDAASPDIVFHLAAIAHPASAAADPERTHRVNVDGTRHVTAGCAGRRLVLASSAAVYAAPVAKERLDERAPTSEATVYGASKLLAEAVAREEADRVGADLVTLRLFNHSGPGQGVEFVCSDFAHQTIQLLEGDRDTVETGDLDPIRDFIDVRCATRAYRLAAELGTPGAIYNVCSGEGRAVGAVISALEAAGGTSIPVTVSGDRRRPGAAPEIVGDHRALTARTGWEPEITFEETIADLLEYWRGAPARGTR